MGLHRFISGRRSRLHFIELLLVKLIGLGFGLMLGQFMACDAAPNRAENGMVMQHVAGDAAGDSARQTADRMGLWCCDDRN